MVNTDSPACRHAQYNKGARQAARALRREKENAYWNDINSLRRHNTSEISRIAREHTKYNLPFHNIYVSMAYTDQRTEKSVRGQLYCGGQLLTTKRKPSLRNAIIKDHAKQLKENG